MRFRLLIRYKKNFLHFQAEAEKIPDLSMKFEVVAVPTCVLIKVLGSKKLSFSLYYSIG